MPARYLVVLDVGSTTVKTILLAGDSESNRQQLIAHWIQPVYDIQLTIEQIMDNVKTALKHQDDGPVEVAVVGHLPEIKNIEIKWAITPEDAFTAVAKRLSASASVLMVDIGSQSTQVALGRFGKISYESLTMGTGVEAWNFLRHPGRLPQTIQWLTATLPDEELENYFATKSLYPELVPISQEELAMEQSLAKAILQQVSAQLPIPWHEIQSVVVTGGVLALPPVATQSAAMVLDGLAPTGIMQLASDPSQLLVAIGGACVAWSAEDYRIGQNLLHQGLKPLGTLVGLPVAPGTKQTAKITLDTGLSQPQVLEVHGGDLMQLPLSESDPGQVSLRLDKTKSAEPQTVVGGEVGVVIDGRGRPVQIPVQANERRVKLLLWDRQLNAHHQYGSFGGNS